MGKGLEWLLPVAAVAATVMTGGAAAPAIGAAAGAGAGAGAAGAGAATGAGLGLAGDALAAQGAAGLLGGAGAAAAGYGAAGAAGAGLAGAAGSAASELPSGMAAYGPNGEYSGATIANDGMTANSFTGGYDALNPLQRGMQRLGSIDLNKGMKLAKSGTDLMGNPQYQQGPQNVSSNVQAAPRQQMPQGSFLSSANNNNNMTEEELKRRSWLQNLGNPNA